MNTVTKINIFVFPSFPQNLSFSISYLISFIAYLPFNSSISISVYPSFHLFFCLFFSISPFCVCVCVRARAHFCQCVFLPSPFYLAFYLSVYPIYVCISVSLSVYLYACLSIYLYICLFTFLSVSVLVISLITTFSPLLSFFHRSLSYFIFSLLTFISQSPSPSKAKMFILLIKIPTLMFSKKHATT